MKVYVCGPMTGLPEFNYPAFIEAERVLVAAGYDVLNPARVDEHHAATDPPCACQQDQGYKHAWEWYMDRCLPMVREARGLAVLPGWLDSRGARIEIELATETIGIPVASVPTWVARHRSMRAVWE